MMWPKDRTRQMLLMSLWVFLHHQLSVVHGLSPELACSSWTQASIEAPHVSPCPRGWLCKAELMAQRKIETFSKHTLYHKGAPNFEGFFPFVFSITWPFHVSWPNCFRQYPLEISKQINQGTASFTSKVLFCTVWIGTHPGLCYLWSECPPQHKNL